jgi:hypothetical protein
LSIKGFHSLERAGRDPASKRLVRVLVAGFEKDPLCADFLRRYSLDRLPNDSKLCQRAAKLLRKQGKEDFAWEVEARGQ